jgi:hypothetical protein
MRRSLPENMVEAVSSMHHLLSRMKTSKLNPVEIVLSTNSSSVLATPGKVFPDKV